MQRQRTQVELTPTTVRAAQLRAFHRSPAAAFGSGLGVLVGAALLWGNVPPALLYSWIAVAVIVTGLRFALWYGFRRAAPDDAATVRWITPTLAGVGAVALLWSLFALAFFIAPDADVRWAVLIVITVVIGAGSLSNAAYLPVHYLFILVVTLPVTVLLLCYGSAIPFLVGMATVVYVGILSLIATAANRVMTDAIVLQIRNAVLFADLNRGKDAAETAERAVRAANEHLERRVEERTAALQAMQEELLQKERLSALGQLTATVAHELRNPLSSIKNTLYTVGELARAKSLKLDRPLERIDRCVERCNRIIGDLLDYSRLRPLDCDTRSLDAWLAQALDE
jgi:signal transduction histidine kinase